MIIFHTHNDNWGELFLITPTMITRTGWKWFQHIIRRKQIQMFAVQFIAMYSFLCVSCLPQSLYMVKYEFQIHVIIVHCCIDPHYLSCPFSSAWSADICEHSEISRDYISLRQKEARPGYDGKPLFTAFFQALGIGMRLPFHNNTVTCTSAVHISKIYTQQPEEVVYTAIFSKFTPNSS